MAPISSTPVFSREEVGLALRKKDTSEMQSRSR
jgi:hypothetical protein